MNQNISMQDTLEFLQIGKQEDTLPPMKIDTFIQEILTVILPKKSN